jgi:hypothetical protein
LMSIYDFDDIFLQYINPEDRLGDSSNAVVSSPLPADVTDSPCNPLSSTNNANTPPRRPFPEVCAIQGIVFVIFI